MDVDPEVLSDPEASIPAAVPTGNAAGANQDAVETAPLGGGTDNYNSDIIMNVVHVLTVRAQELYTSHDIEVRLCWWLACTLVVLWLCVLLAWQAYGHEIMAVLTCQDKLTRSDSMSRESGRRSSADEAQVVTEPPAASSDHPHQSDAPSHSQPSLSAAPHHHSKVD